ncbi:MAG: ATPase, partial [Spirochaetia bacterium]|nr:ATPase [Spirochaetia bacterium]
LDRVWYLQLIESVGDLGKIDRTIASDVFLFEIDLKNLLTLVRYFWYHQMDAKEVQKLLIPLGKVAQSREVASYLKQKETERNPQNLIHAFITDIADETVLSQRGSVHTDQVEILETLKIETYLDMQRKKVYQRMLTADPFSIALPLAYFFLFKEETSMIKAVLNGKYYGYDEQYIKGVLG